MRRTLPHLLQVTKELNKPKSTPGLLLDFAIPLRFLTPVFGGGTNPAEPDQIDYVRVPGVRGALRMWWRALAAEQEQDAQALFKLEKSVWGGVSQGGDDENQRSRVQVSIDVLDRPALVAPGHHQVNQRNGRLGALPRWERDYSNLSYTLFPLQRARDDRQRAEVRGEPRFDTKRLHVGGRFMLRVRVSDISDDDGRLVSRVLASVWAWIQFGGYGARTTRGFGSVGIDPQRSELLRLETEHPKIAQRWRPLFVAPKDARAWALHYSAFEAEMHLSDQPKADKWPVFQGCRIWQGGAGTPQAAHGLLVGRLKAFRQGAKIGRDPSSGPARVGESRWCEPSVTKHIVEALNKQKMRWDHPHRTNATDQRYAPRAAFGLPMQVGYAFKDRLDQQANGEWVALVNGKPVDRYRSPMRLCLIGLANGTALPTVFAFAHRPKRVRFQPSASRARINPAVQDIKVMPSSDAGGVAGLRNLIQQWVGSKGDAVLGFGTALCDIPQNPFKEIR